GLVERAEDWRWGSLRARREMGATERPRLAPWPIERPRDLTARVNRPFGPKEEAVLRSIRRGQPFGSDTWQAEVTARLGLESSSLPAGGPGNRPRKAPDPFCLVQVTEFPAEKWHRGAGWRTRIIESAEEPKPIRQTQLDTVLAFLRNIHHLE